MSLKDVDNSGKRIKIEQLYKFPSVKGDADNMDIDIFQVMRYKKTRVTMLYFFKYDMEFVFDKQTDK